MYRCLPYHFSVIYKPPVYEPIGSYQIKHLKCTGEWLLYGALDSQKVWHAGIFIILVLILPLTRIPNRIALKDAMVGKLSSMSCQHWIDFPNLWMETAIGRTLCKIIRCRTKWSALVENHFHNVLYSSTPFCGMPLTQGLWCVRTSGELKGHSKNNEANVLQNGQKVIYSRAGRSLTFWIHFNTIFL